MQALLEEKVVETYIKDGYEYQVVRKRKISKEELDRIREEKLCEIERRHQKNAPHMWAQILEEEKTTLHHFSVISPRGVIDHLDTPIVRRDKWSYKYCQALANELKGDVFLLSINPNGDCYRRRSFHPKE